MFVIDIKLTATNITEKEITAHRAWFKQYFDQGKFLLVGPRTEIDHAGIIIAQVDSRQELDQIISQDVFYPNDASYQVMSFKANLNALT
ncbi:YciI family protein [Ligilactobacillus equi]|uniref:YCII-related domain-containing protein n=1 Tax=Ligilactobacillus equi DSM 15833 = JCM 10991 TaxID=1423740 RepID=A0A0R1TVD3_9LACO|nr:YciI family protein [Ligilactobacillus equi]KRL82707.1 hypothetical protein FC36_GL000878 [Ligilactobacillus equi DSM 15833 = JCM 10991]